MNFFLVEDSPTIIKSVRGLLEHLGHTLVAVSKNLEEALDVINSEILQEQEVQIAIIDGYFPEKAEKIGASLFGPEVEAKLKEKYPEIKTIAHTSIQKMYVEYGDVYANKVDRYSLRIAIDKIIDLIKNPQT